MLSPKRCWELINKTRGFTITVCDELNSVAASLLRNTRDSHPATSRLWNEKRVIFQSLFFKKELVLPTKTSL